MVALFTAAIWLTVPWIEPGLDRGRLIALGIGWAAATVFELGFGHWVGGLPWPRLLLTLLVGPAVER